MESKKPLHSYVNIKERKVLSLDGITNIERFDDKGVTLATESGIIEIEGSGLKIISLSKEDGVIIIEGRIDGVFYEREKPHQSFFAKFLK